LWSCILPLLWKWRGRRGGGASGIADSVNRKYVQQMRVECCHIVSPSCSMRVSKCFEVLPHMLHAFTLQCMCAVCFVRPSPPCEPPHVAVALFQLSASSPLGLTRGPGLASVCCQPECEEQARLSCASVLDCGHACGGVVGEESCLPCLRGCSQGAFLMLVPCSAQHKPSDPQSPTVLCSMQILRMSTAATQDVFV
jgi:hypothetical protein